MGTSRSFEPFVVLLDQLRRTWMTPCSPASQSMSDHFRAPNVQVARLDELRRADAVNLAVVDAGRLLLLARAHVLPFREAAWTKSPG